MFLKRRKMRFAVIPVIPVRPPYPLGKTLVPEDVLRGPVRRLHHGDAIPPLGGVGQLTRHQLLGNPSSRELFGHPE